MDRESDPLEEPLDPFSGPPESRLDFRLISALVAVVDAGARLLQVSKKHTPARVEKLWTVQNKAADMVLAEIDRRREKRERLEAQHQRMRELGQLPVPLDDEVEDDDEGLIY